MTGQITSRELSFGDNDTKSTKKTRDQIISKDFLDVDYNTLCNFAK